jgi:hypothetical protein
VGAAEALGGACQNGFGCSNGIAANVAVPHPEYGPAFSAQPFVPHGVALAVGVLTAIDLDDELGLAAGKIDDVWADRQLACEFGPVTREQSPYLAFFGR